MKTILAIDDQKDNLTTIQAVLKINMPECEVMTALSGKEGIRIAQEELPDVILLDIIMPLMDGYEVCKRLKKDKATKHIPIIMITAIKTDSDSRVKGLGIGADAFLSKPIDTTELTAQLNVMLRIKLAEDQLRSDKENLEKIVKDRTSELSKKNIKLRSEIDKREIAENALRSIATEFSAISGKEFFEKVCQHLSKTLNVDYAFIGELSSDGSKVIVKTGIGKGVILETFDYDLADTPCEKVMRKDACAYPSGVQDLFPKDHLLIEMGIESYLGIPLFDRKGEALGIMVLLNEKPLVDIEVSSSVLQIFSERVATEMERMQAKAALVESEEKYRNLVERANDGICILQDNQVKFANSYLGKLWGGTNEELMDTPFSNYVHPDELDNLVEFYKKRISDINTPSKYETILKHKNGSKVYAELSAGLISYEGKTADLVFIRDITERKLAEKALSESEKRYRILAENSTDTIWMMNIEGVFLYHSPAIMQLRGYTPEEANKVSMEDTMTPQSMVVLKNIFVRENAKPMKDRWNNLRFELEMFRKDGSKIWTEVAAKAVFDERKQMIGIQGATHDISRRKQAEENIRKLSTAVEQSPSVITITNLKAEIEYVNPKYSELTGYSEDEVLNKKTSILKSGKQSDEFYKELWGKISSGQVWRGEFQNLKKNGEMFWESASISPIFNEEGEITYYVKVAEDITERKLAENIIKEEREFTDAALNKQSDTFFLFEPDTGKAIRWNNAFKENSGYSNDEIAKLPVPASYYSPEDIIRAKDFMQKILKEDKGTIELDLICKNGRKIPTEYSVSVIRDKEQKPKYLVSVGRDITDRKQEEKIQEVQLRLFEYAIDHSTEELLRKFLDEAEILTNSDIGFYHFVEDDQESISLQTWSTNTLNHMCKGGGEATRHYPISKAGVWVDCVKERKAVIHNDYAKLPHKKGLPEGHAPIIRELVVPVIRGKKIVAILGVGNKKTDYDSDDVKTIQRMADAAFETVIRKQAEEELKESERKSHIWLEHSPACTKILDLDFNLQFMSAAGVNDLNIEDISEYYGKPYPFDFYPDSFKIPMRENLKKVKETGQTIIQEAPVVDVNGKELWFHSTLIPVNDENNQLDYIMVLSLDTTKRMQAEIAMQESEEKYRELIEGTKNLITRVDNNGNFTFVNRMSQKFFGISPEECIGLSAFDFIHPDDKQKTTEWFAEFLKSGGKINPFENRQLNKKTGEIYHLLWTSNLIFDDGGNIKGLNSIANDVTAFNITQQTLIESEEKYRSLVVNLPVGIFRSTPEGQVLSANLTMAEIYGYDSVDELLSIQAENYYADNNPREKMLSDLKVNGFLLNYETQENKKDGSFVWVSTNYKANYNDKGELCFIDGVIIDITDKKLADEELKLALVKATESDRLKSAFLATMSHELRTPLNAIIGFSDIISDELAIEDILSFNKNINSSGYHLLSIVEDLFDITLIETGEIKIHLEKENLFSILKEVHEIITIEQVKTNKNHINIQKKIPSEGVDLEINTDASKLKQILINLLKNALKFTHDGHIHYGFEFEQTQTKTELKFFVEDTGIGIPKSKQELIFDIFRQVEDSHTREYGGTGIGLSISKKLCELLGGEIWLESDEGKGSVFYFTIPIEGKEVPAEIKEVVEKIQIESVEESIIETEQKIILIVEDVEESSELLKILIEGVGYKTLWAKNGKEAVDFCIQNSTINLVVMDINMPIMNGYKATIEIKKFRPNLPIIAQTAYAIAGDKEKAFDAGCDDYISKPIKKKELIGKIENLLNS